MTNQISKLIAHIVASFEGADCESEGQSEEEEYTEREESSVGNMYQVNANDSIMKTDGKRDEEYTSNNSIFERGDQIEDQGPQVNEYNSYEDEDDEEEEVHVVDIQSDKEEDESDFGYENYFNDYQIGESGYKMTEEEKEIIQSLQQEGGFGKREEL